ncbi:MAG: Bax inhibitor-1/YccA family protein [Flavobacteriales bacterium]|nr:Bax inhibitor-1/YccA family protein [Flavobacteriales bacterium]
MTRVFGWMTLALTITALTALSVASSDALVNLFLANKFVFYGLIIGQLLLVMGISGLINRISSTLATLLFIIYSAANGLTLSVLFLAYAQSSIALAFFITAGTFAFMVAYGYFTNRDLTSMGSLLFMGLIGIIIASVVNLFMSSETLYWIISYAGVFIFVGLTAYDAQKIKNQALLMNDDSETAQKGAILGALTLYLDFINLFIFILRIFGGRK